MLLLSLLLRLPFLKRLPQRLLLRILLNMPHHLLFPLSLPPKLRLLPTTHLLSLQPLRV
jgi:hypothetical protein